MIKDKIYPKTRDFPMSYNEDITLSIETIKIIGATSLWDVGCGNAAWSIWINRYLSCLLYTSPSPRDALTSRMPSSA